MKTKTYWFFFKICIAMIISVFALGILIGLIIIALPGCIVAIAWYLHHRKEIVPKLKQQDW